MHFHVIIFSILLYSLHTEEKNVFTDASSCTRARRAVRVRPCLRRASHRLIRPMCISFGHTLPTVYPCRAADPIFLGGTGSISLIGSGSIFIEARIQIKFFLTWI